MFASGDPLQRGYRDLPRHVRRMDHDAHGHSRASHCPCLARRHDGGCRAPRACLRGTRRARDRPHRLRHDDPRRPMPEHGFRVAAANRGRRLRRDGRQHRLHELSLRPFHGERDDQKRCRAARAGGRGRAHLALHELGRPQRRGAVRRRRGGRRRGSDRSRRRLVGRETRLLRRGARNPAHSWAGRGVCPYRPPLRHERVAVRGPGDLQEGSGRHGRGVRGRLAPRRQGGWRRRSRRAASGEPAHHRSGGQTRGRADGTRPRQRRTLRQHVGGNRAGGAVRGAGARAGKARRAALDAGVRRGPDVLCASRALGRAHDAARREQRGARAAHALGARDRRALSHGQRRRARVRSASIGLSGSAVFRYALQPASIARPRQCGHSWDRMESGVLR